MILKRIVCKQLHFFNSLEFICLQIVKWFQELLPKTNSSIWLLTGTTTLGQSGPGSNSNERVLHTLQRSRTGALPSDGLVSYLGHSLGGGLAAEMQSAYSTAPTDQTLARWYLIIFTKYTHICDFET